jgi:hypothetical protein
MRKVFKYNLPWTDHADIRMPVGSLPLSVGVQDGQLMLWALVAPDGDEAWRVFRIAGTGHSITEEHIRFIGTVHHQGLVFHVFEDLWG